MKERETDKYESAHIKAVAIEFWRRQERGPTASRTFVRLFVLDYKTERQSRRQSVRIQSALCEVTYDCGCGFKIDVVKIYRIVL